MKKLKIILALAVASIPIVAAAQQWSAFHVRSVHRETPIEHGGEASAFSHYLKMVGTFEGKTYTIEALEAGWSKLEVGKDYPAMLKSGRLASGLVIQSITKKGKPDNNLWHILTVEEN